MPTFGLVPLRTAAPVAVRSASFSSRRAGTRTTLGRAARALLGLALGCVAGRVFAIPEVELNDDRASATTLPLLGNIGIVDVARLNSSFDVDYYKVTMPDFTGPRCMVVTLTPTNADSQLDAKVQVEDANGNVLFESDGGSDNGPETLVVEITANTDYFIRCFTPPTEQIVGNGDYRLRVNITPGAAIASSPEALSILRYGNDTIPIDPNRRTWVVLHGWNSSRSNPNIVALSAKLAEACPGDQILVLDWSWYSHAALPGTAENYIMPTANWAASALHSLGFTDGHNLNLIGHSYGSYVAHYIAAGLGGVNSIVALDPATDPNNAFINSINFALQSNISWAFHSSNVAGSNTTALTADESFVVPKFGSEDASGHGEVVFLFAYMLSHPNDPFSKLFKPEYLATPAAGPWKPNTYDSPFIGDGDYEGYEAILYTNSEGTELVTAVYTPRPPIAKPATAVAPDQFVAQWEQVSRTLSYRLDVSEYSNFSTYLAPYLDFDVGQNTNRTVSGLTPGKTYYYRVRAVHTLGEISSENSNVVSATTTTAGAPTIVTLPPAEKRVPINTTASIAVVASGAGALQYQWEVRANGSSNWLPLSGATSPGLSITASSETMSGSRYRVVVSNGTGTITSTETTLTVVVPPQIIENPPGSIQSVDWGKNFKVTFTGSASGSGVNYAWNTNYGTQNGSTLTIEYSTWPLGHFNWVSTVLHFVASNEAGSAVSSAAYFHVRGSPLLMSTSPQQVTRKAGESVTFSVNAYDEPTSPWYEWHGGRIMGGNSPTGTVSNLTLSDSGVYYAYIFGPRSGVTAEFYLTVVSAPVILTQPVGVTVTQGQWFGLSVSAEGYPGLYYQWRKDGVDIPDFTSPYMNLPGDPANAGNYSVRIYNSEGTVTSNEVAVVIQAPPSIATPPAGLAVSTGSPATFSVVATGSPTLTYQWRKDGVAIPGATSDTLAIGAVYGTNAGGYDVVINNAYGSVTSPVAMLTVNKVVPGIAWPMPAAITFGTPLTSLQLNASATVPGTFSYAPLANTILGAGNSQPLYVEFTPADQSSYFNAYGSTTIRVNKATAAVTLNNLSPVYTGQPLSASATTVPAVGVNFTYNGSPNPPANVGSYAVVATVVDANYQGSATGTLTISKATAAVFINNPRPNYDGAPHPAEVTTQPAGLNTIVTYDGGSTPPVNAGTYHVTATVNDPNYQGSATLDLIINKVDPQLTWPVPVPIPYGTALSATQYFATSNVPGTFNFSPAFGSILPIGMNTLTATFTPTDSVNYRGLTLTRELQVLTNTAPTIGDVTDRLAAAGSSTGPIAVTVSDGQTPAANLVLTASSSNQAIVPNANIVLGGSGANRTIAITPMAGQLGTVTITLTVSDGLLTATDTFVLTVATNTAPTISNVPNVVVNVGANSGALAVTLADTEMAVANLTLTGVSSDTTLIPNTNLVFGGSGANRTVTITPAANQTGTAIVTLTVSDGDLTATDTVVVIVPSRNGAGASLFGVGDLPGGAAYSDVRDVTKVGGVLRAVGGTTTAAGSPGADTAILWTSTDGMVAIPNIVTNLTATTPVFASAITPDGAYIASRSRTVASGGLRQAVRVTTAGLANLSLANLGDFNAVSAANGISFDGQTLYGFGINGSGNGQAIRFTAAGPTATAIPYAQAGDNNSAPAGRAVSANGNVMVGTSTNSAIDGTDVYGPGNTAFYFTSGSGVSLVPNLTGGTWNIGLAVSPDGSVILAAGESPNAPLGEAYVYRPATGGKTSYGTPNGSWRAGNLAGLSGDGSIVALTWASDDGTQGAPYIRNNAGWHNLQALAARAGLNLNGWALRNITGMSANATLVWGNGLHNGHTEGWILEFPAGYLATAAEPVPFSTPGATIVGAWRFGNTTSDDSGVLVLFADGYYMHIQDSAASGAAEGERDGFERGQYTWNAQTGAFTCHTLIDTNGSAGLSGLVGATNVTVTISGDTLTANIPGEPPSTLARVTGTSPIVGAFGRASVANDSAVVVFLPNGAYFMAEDGSADDPTGQDGMERGTYTWDQATGAFTATVLTDTNGEWGLSDSSDLSVITLSPDLVTLLVNGVPVINRISIPPTVTSHPSNRQAIAGNSVTFTVASTGTPAPTYQWKKNGVNIPGATNASYTIPSVQFIDAGSYTVVATNSAGSVTSNAATLTVTESSLAAGEKRVWLMNGTTPQASVSLGQPPAGWEMAATGDFNGDGKSDIVWQNLNTGQRVIWLMNGTTFLGGGELGFVDITWRIAGTGDFNGDGQRDIVWQNLSTGQRVIWLMNGTTFIGGAELGFVDISWQMAGVGDFNGDNKPDIVWQNMTTGQRVIWLMNGTTFMAGAELGFVDLAWQIAAVGDFNADGKADLLWQNRSTGQRSVWYMNGVTLQEGVNLWTRDIGLDLAGIGDFNGDGKMDVLWQEASSLPSDFNSDWMADLVLENTATGERRLWLLDQNLGVTGAILPILDTNWRLAASLDLNQDGKTDLLLRNQQTGVCRAWYMNGPNYVSAEDLWVVDSNWEIAATADLNRDGQPDLLWQNRATGQRSIWYMNGKTYLNGENLWVVEPNWDLVAAADLNHDGQADLLWQNLVTGQRSVWYMNGTALVSGENLWMVEPDWDLVGVRDFNRDGSVDLVWQHRVSGQRSAWYLNGTTYLSGVNLWMLDPNWRFAF